MTMLNLGKFVTTLDTMNQAIELQSGTAGNRNAWQAPRTNNTPREVVRTDSLPALSILTNGDGTLKTYDIAQEIIHEGLSGKALTGNTNLWFDGEVHRPLNQKLNVVREVLVTAVKQIVGDDKVNLENYLLHVNDLDANACMVRPQGQSFSYFASQLAIIDPKGSVHFLSMDRVKSSSVSYLSYAWRAVAVEDYEVSIQHDERNGTMRYEEATDYVKVGNVRIPMFSRKFGAIANLRGGMVEYAYRPAQREVAALVRPFGRQQAEARVAS